MHLCSRIANLVVNPTQTQVVVGAMLGGVFGENAQFDKGLTEFRVVLTLWAMISGHTLNHNLPFGPAEAANGRVGLESSAVVLGVVFFIQAGRRAVQD